MATTRQHLNEAAHSVAKLLGMIRGMTDDEIDRMITIHEAFLLAKSAHSLATYAEKQKNHE